MKCKLYAILKHIKKIFIGILVSSVLLLILLQNNVEIEKELDQHFVKSSREPPKIPIWCIIQVQKFFQYLLEQQSNSFTGLINDKNIGDNDIVYTAMDHSNAGGLVTMDEETSYISQDAELNVSIWIDLPNAFPWRHCIQHYNGYFATLGCSNSILHQTFTLGMDSALRNNFQEY